MTDTLRAMRKAYQDWGAWDLVRMIDAVLARHRFLKAGRKPRRFR